MSKKLKILSIVAALLFTACFCACSDKENAQSSSKSDTAAASASSEISSEKGVDDAPDLKISTKCNYSKIALNFDELVEDADLIVKIKVKEAKGFIADNYLINTEVTPQVIEIYKGSYNGEKLYANGGKMLYSEYVKNEHIKKTLSGRENGNQPKYVEQAVDDSYFLQVGDEYIFFAKKNDDGEMYALYGYQGTFKLQGGKVQNAAISVEEPLYESLNTKFGGITAKKSADSVLQIDEADFVKQLK